MSAEPRSRSFVGHAATYAIGNVARKLVGFLMLPVYTRFLTPADYGVIGLLTFALAVLEPIFGARLGRAIPKFYYESADPRSKSAVIWGAISLTSIVSAVSMVALILFRGVGSRLLFGDDKYALALGLFGVNLLTRPIEDTGLMYVRMRERSRLFLGISLTKLLLQLLLNLVLVVYWNGGVIGVVLSGIISSVVVGGGLVAYVAMNVPPTLDGKMIVRMLKFCWPLWFSGLAGLYVASSGAMYLRIFGSLSDVGRLELAIRFATAVGMLVWAPFFQHWEPMSYRYYNEPGGNRKFQVAFIAMGALLFSGGLGVSIFAQPVIRFMAAKSFAAAAGIVPILTLGFILNSLRSFFNFSFLATGKTKIQSLNLYITAVAITVAYTLLIPRFGLSGAAVGWGLTSFASFVYIRMISRRYYDPGFDLGPVWAFAMIGIAAYLCSNVLFRVGNSAINLLIKSSVLLVASGFIALIALRAIRGVDESVFKGLPWPLNVLHQGPRKSQTRTDL